MNSYYPDTGAGDLKDPVDQSHMPRSIVCPACEGAGCIKCQGRGWCWADELDDYTETYTGEEEPDELPF